MRLDELKSGQTGIIVKILGHGAFRKRLIEMGFVKGHHVNVLLHAPLRDPIKYSIMGYEVSLRAAEAHLVEVIPIDTENNEDKAPEETDHMHSVACNVSHDAKFNEHRKTINVALVGNPNCGKTSLFNIASGAKEHVGNYSGVTVDAKSGKFSYAGYTFNIVDLPGTYSLSAYSPEELYVRNYLRDETPDIIINVVAASNLERNLYLTTDLITMDRSMVIALNMFDELEKNGDTLDYKLLGEMIGVPMIPTAARNGNGISELFDTVIAVFEGCDKAVRHVHINFGHDLENAVKQLTREIKADPTVDRHFSPRYLAIKLLEHDPEVETTIRKSETGDAILASRSKLVKSLEQLSGDDISSTIANERYGFISGALAETMHKGDRDPGNSTTLIDALVTNKLFGFPIFLAAMFFIFWCTFEIGSYPMEWIENGVQWLNDIISQYMPEGILKNLITNGIIGGVGGVIVFLPNILILYFCISFMEDSGYMARAAFIMDRLMHRIGLHGKSFIPLIMGFGCNVPAIMASRSIESHSSRLITILINPFMSCSARLPIYVLLVGTFFPNHAATVFLCLYLLGILIAMATAKLLRKFYFKADETPFVMELPPYRVPTLKSSLRHMWGKGEQYLKKMGGIILVASIVVWALNYFPRHEQPNLSDTLTVAKIDDSKIDPDSDSFLEMAGKAINPIMKPIGCHWRATVAALAGVPAKEIVVSTLGVLYTGDEEIDNQTLSSRLTALNQATDRPDFTPASALAFMVFILLYCPCFATIVAIVRETGSWRYGAFSVIYNTAVAWIAAFITYQVASLF